MKRAFTLIEILLVIALMGLATGLIVVDFFGFPARLADRTDIEALGDAVAEARGAAGGGPVLLACFVEKKALAVDGPEGRKLFPLRGRIAFRSPAEEGRGNEREISVVFFSPEGDMTPVVFETESEGVRRRYRIEPFSGALTEEKP